LPGGEPPRTPPAYLFAGPPCVPFCRNSFFFYYPVLLGSTIHHHHHHHNIIDRRITIYLIIMKTRPLKRLGSCSLFADPPCIPFCRLRTFSFFFHYPVLLDSIHHTPYIHTYTVHHNKNDRMISIYLIIMKTRPLKRLGSCPLFAGGGTPPDPPLHTFLPIRFLPPFCLRTFFFFTTQPFWVAYTIHHHTYTVHHNKIDRRITIYLILRTCKRAACGLVVPPYHRANP